MGELFHSCRGEHANSYWLELEFLILFTVVAAWLSEALRLSTPSPTIYAFLFVEVLATVGAVPEVELPRQQRRILPPALQHPACLQVCCLSKAVLFTPTSMQAGKSSASIVCKVPSAAGAYPNNTPAGTYNAGTIPPVNTHQPQQAAGTSVV